MTEAVTSKRSIDVRVIPHFERHQRVFGMLKSLGSGESMEVTADHDPIPLQYQLEMNYPGVFKCAYLENGPNVWRLEIERRDGRCCGVCDGL
ncbi:DUF2249 domain-containing protein [Rhodomicrobium vannielii ATCC 17100]|uniref:DUF2249 domain-containing protein n=1 Tax=Rhodomicrobium vannielii TaxID=1069 RepID=UPI001918C7CA|nr:DUF2249 domain-containing protein [Rhodomicrobium vannielii]MBJ7534914.1 DUF2249 domain-containing protein [Rhodomicrobium vannielii ATCC 17100]